MQSTLTKEQIESAIKREGVRHPAITVLQYADALQSPNLRGYAILGSSQEQCEYIRKHYGVIGDALEEAGEFSLGPLDLVAIWSEAMKVWHDNRYPRYSFAGMLSAAYGIQGRPDLKGLGRFYLENAELPDGLVRDKSGLVHISERLGYISASLDELDLYVFRAKGDYPMELAAQLAMKSKNGDEEAKKQLVRLIAREKEYQNPVLRDLHENFENGMSPFAMQIHRALKR